MTIVIDNQKLQELCEEIDKGGRFALDMEFIPERTYLPELCLVQVATDYGAYIIDPLALKDLEPLWQRVANPNILVVLHAADQDLDLVFRYSSLLPQNIMDTQVAAGFAGFGFPIGYAKLLQVLKGISISKTESFTDWLIRPLTEEQIDYALDDVRHLLPLYDKLTEKLNANKRFDWAAEECELYCDPSFYEKDRSRQYLRIKGASGLPRRGQAILKALSNWRDEVAKTHNRPPRSILSDAVLMEVARRPPRRPEELGRIRSVRPDQIRTYGALVVNAVQEAINLPDSELPVLGHGQIPSKEDLIQGDVLFLVLKTLCYEQNLAAEIVATRDELQHLLRVFREGTLDSHELPVMTGWRKEVAGDVLLAILMGKEVAIKLGKAGQPIKLNLI
jgi:ribonuclease D